MALGIKIKTISTLVIELPYVEKDGCCRDVWREAGIDVNTLYTEQRNGSVPENQDLWVCCYLPSATFQSHSFSLVPAKFC